MDRSMREGGQATVELVLVLPILVLVILALLEASFVGADQVRVSHAAREGARVAAVKPERDAIEAAVAESGLPGAEVEVDPPSSERTQGGAVTVTVTYHPHGHLPFIGELFANLRLTSVATIRVEIP